MKPQSRLETKLSEEQQGELADALLAGMKYHQAVEFVREKFGMGTSISALSRFWERNVEGMLLARRQRAVRTSEEIAREAKARPGEFDAATLDALKQKAFEIMVSPSADPRDVKALMGLALKARDQDLEERRIRLLETKAAQADAAKGILEDGALSEEERGKRMRQLFGM